MERTGATNALSGSTNASRYESASQRRLKHMTNTLFACHPIAQLVGHLTIRWTRSQSRRSD